MSVVQASIEIDAPPDKVWEIVSDPTNLPKWDRHIVSVHGVPEDGLKEGSKYSTSLRYVGLGAKVSAEVLEMVPLQYAKVRLSGVLDATVETWLEPLDGERTKLSQRVDYRFKGGPLGRLAAHAVRTIGAARELRHGVEAQKRQVEGSLA